MTLDPKVQEALEKDLVIDITTTGRKSGKPRRREIWFHNVDGELYIVGLVLPGSRSWYANVLAEPRLIFHLKGTAQADLPARATPLTDPAERRRVLERVCANLDQMDMLEARVAESPVIRVDLEDR